jgi:hypothetical protein
MPLTPVAPFCSPQAHLASGRLQQWISFWRLTGAESLFITAMGFKVTSCVMLLDFPV